VLPECCTYYCVMQAIGAREVDRYDLSVVYCVMQAEGAREVEKKQREQLAALGGEELRQFAIKGSEQDWDRALTGAGKGLISVKR